jgi:hypothetical protein
MKRGSEFLSFLFRPSQTFSEPAATTQRHCVEPDLTQLHEVPVETVIDISTESASQFGQPYCHRELLVIELAYSACRHMLCLGRSQDLAIKFQGCPGLVNEVE